MVAASDFVRATEQTLLNRLNPGYPLTNLDSRMEADRACRGAYEKLDQTLAKVERLLHDLKDEDLLVRSQEAWKGYSALQAELRAHAFDGGSIQPRVHLRELTRLV